MILSEIELYLKNVDTWEIKNKLIYFQGLFLKTSIKETQKPSAHVPHRLKASHIKGIFNVLYAVTGFLC
jgi:hypothetical protein